LQFDVWTAVDTQYPCQISITQLDTQMITTWAFDGFAGFIPVDAVSKCSIPKILCSEANWLCISKPGTPDDKLNAALQWLCDPTHFDCTAINPGGSHYIPDTPQAHADWAFNAYFDMYRSTQGIGACDFGGIAYLVPPNATKVTPQKPSSALNNLFAVFSNDIVCDRS